MRYIWSRCIIILLCVEALVFIVNYNVGSSGLQVLHRLKNTKKLLQDDIEILQLENSKLQEQIDEWSSGVFLQEKYARERLYMQKKDEIIYLR